MNYRKRKKHGEKMKFGGIHDHIHYRWNGTHLADIKGFFENPDLLQKFIFMPMRGVMSPISILCVKKLIFML